MDLDEKKEVRLRTKVNIEEEPDFLTEHGEKNVFLSANVLIRLGIFLLLAVIVILLVVLINQGGTVSPAVPQTSSAVSVQEEKKTEPVSEQPSTTQEEPSQAEEPASEPVSEPTSEQEESSEEPVEESSEEASVYALPEPEKEESSSPKMLVIDRVINRTQSDAEQILKDRGFQVEINKIYSDGVEWGKVVSQSPAYFTLLEQGGTVTLNVSRGKQEEDSSQEASTASGQPTVSYDIPIINVAGRPENDAAKILKSQGFTVQTVYMSSTSVRKGCVIEQSPAGGIKQKYGESVTLYVSKGLSVTLTLEANGGYVSSTKKVLEYGGRYGSLPTPQRTNYDFLGWYTDIVHGQRVTENAIVGYPYDHILYAHWKAKPISGWILEKDVPSGARVAEVKWVYTKTQTISSELPVMGGWKQAGSYWKAVGSGTNYYADFNSGINTGYNRNDKYYAKYNHSSLSSYNDGSQKRDVKTQFYTYLYWHWCSNVISVPPENMPVAGKYGADIYSPNGNYLGRAMIWEVFESKNNGKSSNGKYEMKIQSRYSYWWNRITVYVQQYTDYKKYYQYYKVTQEESRTAVRESDTISNVRKYIRYYLP